MTIEAIREKLHDFIDHADDKKVEAIFTLVEGEITEKLNWWEDEEFVKELDQRVEDYESGKTKAVSWEQIKLNNKKRLNSEK